MIVDETFGVRISYNIEKIASKSLRRHQVFERIDHQVLTMNRPACQTHFSHQYIGANGIKQGRPTGGPRKGFEWPAQYFLKPSIPSILAKVEDRFDVNTPFFLFFFSSFRDHYDFGTKSGQFETDFRRGPFFSRDHYDFRAKSRVFCLFGPPIFSISQSGSRLKKVGHPWYKALFYHSLKLFQSFLGNRKNNSNTLGGDRSWLGGRLDSEKCNQEMAKLGTLEQQDYKDALY